MKTIKLPCFGITITLSVQNCSGHITSDLHKTHDTLDPEELHAFEGCEAAINGMESLILACACEGLNVENPAFLCAIETCVNAIMNNQ